MIPLGLDIIAIQQLSTKFLYTCSNVNAVYMIINQMKT